MARNPNLTCAGCDKRIWKGSTSLPQGEATCRPCRKANVAGRMLSCEHCLSPFNVAYGTRRFCSKGCANAFFGILRRVRPDDDPRATRADRERSAPGLGQCERKQLLDTWKMQKRACTYCDSLATTIDHVVPLIYGGTNFEGNLVPACRRCNGSKGGKLLVEWRTGRRISVSVNVPWEIKAASPKPKKQPKPAKASAPCRICGTLTTRLDCSADCRRESSKRKTRDAYRMSVGLPVDFNEPSKEWRKRQVSRERYARAA